MNESPLASPVRRFWGLMKIVGVVAAVAIVAALFYAYARGTPLRLHFVLAMSLGIGLTLLLAGALMGLLFFSARSGHDEAAFDRDDLDDR
jgi:ABC-type nickel/cobalt efflux system permease component RcnA